MLFRSLADAVESRKRSLVRMESANAGKPISAVGLEIDAVVDNLRFFAGAARNMEGKAVGEYLPGRTSMIRRDPVGVVASIAPWNYPILMAGWKIGPALVTGNTVVNHGNVGCSLSALCECLRHAVRHPESERDDRGGFLLESSPLSDDISFN